MARIWMIIATMCLTMSVVFGQAATGTYRLKPDDIITIGIYGERDVQTQVPVGPDGNISAPYVGILRADGKTTSELESELTELYKKVLKLRDPKVSVTILRFRAVRCTITGAVNRAGTYDVRPGDRLVQLIGFGQGYVFDRADLKRCTLRRGNTNELIPVDLDALLNRGDTSQNYELEDGDEFTVPEGFMNRIMVQGAVNAPGFFGYRPGMRLADAMALARGDIPGRTKMSEIYVVRELPGQPNRVYRIRCDFVKFVRKGDAAQNIELQPGDYIFASFTKNPSFSEIGSIVNSILVTNTFLRDGLFGFRLFRF